MVRWHPGTRPATPSFPHEFSTPVLCFHRHSRFVPRVCRGNPSTDGWLPEAATGLPLRHAERKVGVTVRHMTVPQRSSVDDFLSFLPAPASDSEALTLFAQVALFLFLSGSNLCQIALKTDAIYSTQKSHILYFQVLLSFVSTILHFP